MHTEDMGAELLLHFYKTVEQNVYAKMRLNIPKKIIFFTSVIQLAIKSWQRFLLFLSVMSQNIDFQQHYWNGIYLNQVIIKHIHHPTNWSQHFLLYHLCV